MNEVTEITIQEDGTETHESWLLIRANRISGSQRLFDSEITHQHYIKVEIKRCERERRSHHDYKFATNTILEMAMSEAQWGAFVSSFGNGSGVPATLERLEGRRIPGTPVDSRLNESHKEVFSATDKASEEIKDAVAAIRQAHTDKAGRKAMESVIRDLEIRLGNMPSNMEFVAKSLTEHVEQVVTKARRDVEGMVMSAQENGLELERSHLPILELGDGS